MMRVARVALFLSISMAASFSPPAHATIILGSILDDLERHVESLQSSLQSQINITEANTLENLRQTIETLRSEFKDDLDKETDKVDTQVQAVLYSVRDSINRINGDISTQRAEIQVAGTKLIQQASFWRSAVPFIVAGIDHQVLSKTDGEYRVRVYGNGFGIDEGDQRYNLKVTLYGQDLPSTAISPLADGVDLVLPHSLVDPLFFQSQPHRVPVEFNDSIYRECSLALRIIGRSHCTDNYKAVFNITLAPVIAASATLESSKNGVSSGAVKTVDGPAIGVSPDKHNNGTYPDFPTPPYTAPAGWIVQEAHFTGCSGTSADNGECQFNFSPHCTYAADQKTVQCFVTVGSHPHTNRWAITIVEQVPAAAPFPSRSYDFPSNRNISLDVYADSDAAKLIGQTADGKPFQIGLKPFTGTVGDPVYCPNSPIPADSSGTRVLRFTCLAAVE